MVKDHSDSEKGNPLPPHRLLLSINSKGSFICTIPDRITHATAANALPLSYVPLLLFNGVEYILPFILFNDALHIFCQ